MDDIFMEQALEEAQAAFLAGEVPVGAVLVFEGQVIAKAHNNVECLHNATAHAEMSCLQQGFAHFKNWRLPGTTLYCTLEPCAMCLGALLLARVPRLVWGAPDLRHGANGSWVNLLSTPHPMHTIEVTSGILAGASSALLRRFFQERRANGSEKEPRSPAK